MALILQAKLFNVVVGSFTDRESGEVKDTNTLEFLNTTNGKTEITTIKCDASMIEGWKSLIGQDLMVPVKTYGLKTEKGEFISGYSLAEKTKLPVPARALKAA